MKSFSQLWKIICIYSFILLGIFLSALIGNRAVTVLAENRPIEMRRTVIIDAGHGGVDGGATSCTGVLESQLNLEIALMLEDTLHLLGLKTHMIRRTDISVYTSGETIGEKKISDLKERVRLVNSTPDAILISIHQNHFLDPQYRGAQVFYAQTEDSQWLATQLQQDIVRTLNPNSKRKAKKANGVYLMQHIEQTGVLVECGFLSNPQEENLLRSTEYQQKLCCVIASSVSRYLAGT